jgi:hypothetical protein
MRTADTFALRVLVERRRASVAAAYGFALLAAAASGAESFQSQAVDGILVQLQVDPSRPHSSTEKGETDHRIVVMLGEKATGRPIADASVAVEVAKAGRVGARWPLAPSTLDVRPAFVGDVPMAGRGTTYRILVQFRRPGDTETFEAEFRYAHH